MFPHGLLPALLIAAAAVAWPQETGPENFEVASVKPAALPRPGSRFSPLTGGPGTKTPTRLSGSATFHMLLTRAYGVRTWQIEGPSWMETEMYDIDARVAPGATKEQVTDMWRTLLAERFHLAVHRETKEFPLWMLTVGKGGPKLKEADPAAAQDDEAPPPGQRPRVTMGPDGFPQIPADAKMPGSFVLSLVSGEFTRIKLFAKHQTMDELADSIGGFVKAPVRNQTGLAGSYDFTLAFESDPMAFARAAGGPPDTAPPARENAGPTIFAAVQEQLGLKLEHRKGPVEMLVIDRVEKTPTGN